MKFSDYINKKYPAFTEQDINNNLDKLFEEFFYNSKNRLFEGVLVLIENEEVEFEEAHGLYVTMENEKIRVVILLDYDDTIKKKMKIKDISCWDIERIEFKNPKE